MYLIIGLLVQHQGRTNKNMVPHSQTAIFFILHGWEKRSGIRAYLFSGIQYGTIPENTAKLIYGTGQFFELFSVIYQT